MKPFIITNQLGQNFNLSIGWEYWLQLEDPADLPLNKQPEGFNTATLVVKLLTGAIQLFPMQTMSTLIGEIMPGLQVNLFEGFYVEPMGTFWKDPEKKPRETIQPLYRLVAPIEGSRYRKLLREFPESATWTTKQKAEKLPEIAPDELYVENVPYSTVWHTGAKLGIQFFKDYQAVLDQLEQAYPSCVTSHNLATYLEANIRAPFDELRKKLRTQKINEANQRSGRSGIITNLKS